MKTAFIFALALWAQLSAPEVQQPQMSRPSLSSPQMTAASPRRGGNAPVLWIAGTDSAGGLDVRSGWASFSRASSAYEWTGSTLVNRSTDYARDVCSPSDPEGGICIEGQRTAIDLNGDAPSAWPATRVVWSADVGADLEDNTTADGFAPTAEAGTHYSGPVLTTLTPSQLAWSGWLQFVQTASWATMNLNENGVSYSYSYIDVANCALGAYNGAAITFRDIQAWGSWRRPSIAITNTGAGVIAAPVYGAVSNNGAAYTGDETNNMYVWGAQLEADFPSSRIKTSGAGDVTRAADKMRTIGARLNRLSGAFSAQFTPLFDYNWLPEGGKYYLFDSGGVEIYYNLNDTEYRFVLTDGVNKVYFDAQVARGTTYAIEASWGRRMCIDVNDAGAVCIDDFARPTVNADVAIGCDENFDNCAFAVLDDIKIYAAEIEP